MTAEDILLEYIKDKIGQLISYRFIENNMYSFGVNRFGVSCSIATYERKFRVLKSGDKLKEANIELIEEPIKNKKDSFWRVSPLNKDANLFGEVVNG